MRTVTLEALVAVIGADPPANAAAPAMSIWDFAVKGGPTMAIIALCSLVALTLVVERSILTRRRRVIPPEFLASVRATAGDRQRCLDLCRASPAPIAAVLAAAVMHAGDPDESRRRAISEAGRREVSRLRNRMRLLGALPQVATMLGLLGTVFGMIKIFQAVAASGQSLGKTEMLARGIFEAWANTAAGLLVAIPTLIAYHVIMGRVDARVTDLDRVATDWLEEERAGRVSQPARSAPAPEPARAEPPVAAVPAAV
jgi:biopolymer transport protein ExbB